MLDFIILTCQCIFQYFMHCYPHLQLSYYCGNIKLCYITGTPILMAAIIIPSCSSQRCWLATSHSHPTRRSTWEWHTLWGNPQPITIPLPKRTNSTRCLPGSLYCKSSYWLLKIITKRSWCLSLAFDFEVFYLWNLCILPLMWQLPSPLSFYKEHVSVRGVVLSGGAVPTALQAGEGKHAPTLRCATERLCLQLPAPAKLWGRRVGG